VKLLTLISSIKIWC